MRIQNLLITSALLALAPVVPAHAEMRLNPHASLSEEYDSNISYSSQNEISDMITRLEAGLALQYSGKLDSIALTGSIFHRFYKSHSSFNNTGENLGLTMNHEFSRFDRIRISDRYGHGTEPRSLEEEFGRSAGSYTFTNNVFDLAYTHDFGNRLTGTLNYAIENTVYSREDLSDSVRNTFGAGAEFAFDSKNIGLVDFSHTIREYTPGGTATVDSLTAGVRHYFSSQLNLQAVAGYDFIKSADGTSYTNPVTVLTLTDEITDKLQARLSYQWSNSTSNYDGDVFKNNRLSLSFSEQYNQRLKFDIQAFYGSGTYEQAQVDQVLHGASCGFQYELLRHIMWTSRLGYSQQSSNVASNEYSRTYASTGVRVEF